MDCPDGLIPFPNHSDSTDCFYFGSESMGLAMTEAKIRCKQQNPNITLASIHTEEENDFIANMSHPNTFLHLNGRKITNADVWIWQDGTAFDFENWGDIDGDGECLAMMKDGTWSPRTCSETTSQFVCRIGRDPLSAMATTTTSSPLSSTTPLPTTTAKHCLCGIVPGNDYIYLGPSSILHLSSFKETTCENHFPESDMLEASAGIVEYKGAQRAMICGGNTKLGVSILGCKILTEIGWEAINQSFDRSYAASSQYENSSWLVSGGDQTDTTQIFMS